MAYKAVYANEALLGVTGIEFTYDTLVDYMKKFGCTSKVSFNVDQGVYIKRKSIS